jgi:hypothetical protein
MHGVFGHFTCGCLSIFDKQDTRAGARGQIQLGGVLSQNQRSASGVTDRADNKLSQLSVTDHSNVTRGSDVHLVQDL